MTGGEIFDQLGFYFRYALDHLRRERQRTLFVVFCIAVGVGAVVSLRNLGLMIGATLASDLQASNRADMVIRVPEEISEDWKALQSDGSYVPVDKRLFDTSKNLTAFSSFGQARLRRWASAGGYSLQPSWSNGGPFTGIHKSGSSSSQEYIQIFCVDPVQYPFYGRVSIQSPPGAGLSQALQDVRQIVISEQLVIRPGLQPGDQVFLTGVSGAFTVSAVANAKSEASLTNPIAVVFPFVYLSMHTCQNVLNQNPSIYYVQIVETTLGSRESGENIEAIRSAFLAQFPGLATTTVEDMRVTNQEFSQTLTRLVTVMGLVSLLIGGIGIANSIMVAVSRRTLEIAVLKTIGLQGSQIVNLFLVEVLALGVLGSLVGLGVGIALLSVLLSFGERFISQALVFTVYPQALVMGVFLGMAVTLAFGLLPILAAGRVRPNLVLHPDSSGLSGMRKNTVSGSKNTILVILGERGASFLVVLALVSLFGVIIGQILDDFTLGLLAAYGVAILLGFFAWLLRLVVWFLSRLPAFGNASLRLAQRDLEAHPGRAANTLLALTSGVFSISLIWVLVQGTVKLVEANAENYLGGNVLVLVQTLDAGQALERKFAHVPGAISYVHDTMYQAEIVAINGDDNMQALTDRALQQAIQEGAAGNPARTVDAFVHSFTMKVLEDDTWSYKVRQGDDISPRSGPASAAGANQFGEEQRMLLEMLSNSDTPSSLYRWFGLQPGDTLTFEFPGGARRTARIAGVVSRPNVGVILQGLIDFRATTGIVPERFVPRSETAIPSIYYLTIEENSLAAALDELAVMPGIFISETRQYNVYIERFAETFVPLPMIVAALALFASAVIIANTVALSILERRRQIGVMKALGLQTEQVLGILLIENALVGLAGGLLGVLLATGVMIGGSLLGEDASNLPAGALILLIILAIALALCATLLAAWSAVRERSLNVLRYE